MVTEEQVIIAINQALDLNLDIENTPRNEALKDLGIDSLDFFNILIALEEITGRKVSDEDSERLVTIKDIAEYFS